LIGQKQKKHADYIRKHGLKQFLNIYTSTKNRLQDGLRWGDEIEYILVHLDDQEKKARICLRGKEILERLLALQAVASSPPSTPTDSSSISPPLSPTSNASFADALALAQLTVDKSVLDFTFQPEYGNFMIESTPGRPYGSQLEEILKVEKNMRERRAKIEEQLRPNERILSIGSFPLLGSWEEKDYLFPFSATCGEIAESIFVSDAVINPHNRFGALTRNIRKRRGKKVEINIPLYIDSKTDTAPFPPNSPAQPNSIYMDAMAFGMGCCCLQCTFQCCNIMEARQFYDQFTVLAPILLALTASTPLYRGRVSAQDVRWNVISMSVDDRTPEEYGEVPLKENKMKISKSRYDSVDCFISTELSCKPEFNDIKLEYDQDIYLQLKNSGVDELLSRHLAHLFIRDPLVIYEHRIELDDSKHNDHFENIQSTNWQTARFKPPPPGSSMGWRVECRPMELQSNDFANAAFAVLVLLLTRLFTCFDCNFYIPLSKIDENMKRAHKMNAINTEKFYFRNAISRSPDSQKCLLDSNYSEFTINEIFNGNPQRNFIGIVPMIRVYLETLSISEQADTKIQDYLNFISRRASGELITDATFIRDFVLKHPAYRQDSIVTHEINYDLIQTLDKIAHNTLIVPNLVPAEYLKKP